MNSIGQGFFEPNNPSSSSVSRRWNSTGYSAADLAVLGALQPRGRVDRPGDDDHAAGFLGDPFLEHVDLAGVELRPVGVERDDRSRI